MKINGSLSGLLITCLTAQFPDPLIPHAPPPTHHHPPPLTHPPPLVASNPPKPEPLLVTSDWSVYVSIWQRMLAMLLVSRSWKCFNNLPSYFVYRFAVSLHSDGWYMYDSNVTSFAKADQLTTKIYTLSFLQQIEPCQSKIVKPLLLHVIH